jgi:aspartate ammonia-lyase
MNQVCFEVIGNDAAITMAVKPASCSSTPSSR